MAKPKYKATKGEVRTPEEHRRILQEIDAKQSERSRKGVQKSVKRLKNTFGVSSSAYKKERKPKNKKPKIYDLGRYARE